MLACSNSPKSTNCPETIWLTTFAGTGEKPGPTTKVFVLSRSEGTMKVELAPSGEEERDGPTTVLALDEGKIERTGAEKVFTNEGTANECVPVCGAPDMVEGINERAP